MNPTPDFSHEHPIKIEPEHVDDLTYAVNKFGRIVMNIIFIPATTLNLTDFDGMHPAIIVLSMMPSKEIRVDPYVEESLRSFRFNVLPSKLVIPTEEGNIYCFISENFNKNTQNLQVLFREFNNIKNKYEQIKFLGMKPEDINIQYKQICSDPNGIIYDIIPPYQKQAPYGYHIVTKIDKYGNAIEIKFKDYVTSIPNNYCEEEHITTVKNVIFPEPSKCKITKIGSHAFSNTNLVKITIPDTVTKIGEYAFHQTPNLRYVYLPDSIEVIEKGTFSRNTDEHSLYMGGSNLAVRLPKNLTTVEQSAFSGVTLEVTELPETLKFIGMESFQGLHIVNEVSEPIYKEETIASQEYIDNLLNIPDVLNEQKPAVHKPTVLKIPKDIKVIGTRAFESVVADELVILPDTEIEELGAEIFKDAKFNKVSICSQFLNNEPDHKLFLNLTLTGSNPTVSVSQEMHPRTRNIFTNLAYKDSKCLPVTVDLGNTQLIDEYTFGSTKVNNLTVKTSAEKCRIDQHAFNDSDTMCLSIHAKNLHIGIEAFSNNSYLKFILIKAEQVTIHEGAFDSCPELKGIYLNCDKKQARIAEEYKSFVRYTRDTDFGGHITFTKDTINILSDVTYPRTDEILRDFSYYIYSKDVIISRCSNDENLSNLHSFPVRKIEKEINRRSIRYILSISDSKTEIFEEYFEDDFEHITNEYKQKQIKQKLKDIYNINI